MARRLRRWLVPLTAVLFLSLGAAMWMRGRGFDARAAPSRSEVWLARAARGWLVPTSARGLRNPVIATPQVIDAGLRHWADHCASCHGNDGRGQTPIGRSLYPQAPDMRGVDTQSLTDGELFYVIEQGIPLTGMPAWRTGTTEGEHATWELVAFIRHLPSLSAEEITRMEALNPKSAAQRDQEQRLDDFLKGGR